MDNMDDLLPAAGAGRDEMMQFYTWTFEDAWEAQEKGENVCGRGPFFRWLGAQELKELYNVYQAGNIHAVVEALFLCSMNSLPIPRWCEMAYLKAYRRVRHYKDKSWDDVFGLPHKKGTHLATKRQERENGLKVYFRIVEIKKNDPSVPIDGNLFEMVGREFGIGGKTLTEEYYYKWKNRIHKNDINTDT